MAGALLKIAIADRRLDILPKMSGCQSCQSFHQTDGWWPSKKTDSRQNGNMGNMGNIGNMETLQLQRPALSTTLSAIAFVRANIRQSSA